MNLPNIKKNGSLWIFSLVVLFFLFSLYQRQANEDEGIIAGQAYQLSEKGFIQPDGGYLVNSHEQLHYHKLFVLSGAFLSKMFGFHIYTFKAISLVFVSVFFFFLYKYILEFEKDYSSKNFFFFAASILLVNHLFFNHSFMYRPEIMVMSLGFISFYFLKKGLKEKHFYWFILAGACAGLAGFTHLNGLIFFIAGFFLLLLKKQLKPLLIYSFFAIVFTFFYFLNIHSFNDLELVYQQISQHPTVINNEPFIVSLFKEHMRFFWSLKETSFSLIFFTTLILNFKKIKETHKDLLIYFLSLVIALGLIAVGKTTKYALNYFPFMALIIVPFLLNINAYSRFIKFAAFALVALYFGIQSYFNLGLMSKRMDITRHNAELAKLIPEKNVNLSAPSTFVFNQIQDFSIRGELAFDHHYKFFKPTEKRSTKNYFDFARYHGDEYILIDKRTNTKDFCLHPDLDTLKPGQNIFDYKLILKENDILLFKNDKF